MVGTFADCFNPQSTPAAVSTPKPAEFVPGSWTLILLPDTQYYSDRFPGVFTLQTHWIAKNKEKYNIRYVLHLGDITDRNTEPSGGMLRNR